jgi:hypothetical protein
MRGRRQPTSDYDAPTVFRVRAREKRSEAERSSAHDQLFAVRTPNAPAFSSFGPAAQ